MRVLRVLRVLRVGDACGAVGPRPAFRAPSPAARPAASRRSRSGNTQARKSRKRSTVAARLAATSTVSSLPAEGLTVAAARAASDPLVSASPMAKTTSPCAWWRTARSRPRTPNVNRRLAAVLASVLTNRAAAFATWGPTPSRQREYRPR